jgi:hypothetical protein
LGYRHFDLFARAPLTVILSALRAREKRLRCGTAEKRKDTEEGHKDNQDSSVEPTCDVQERNCSKENGSCKIGADEDRFASSAIHERTDDQAQEKIWQPSGRVHQPDIHCSAVQRQQYENLQEQGLVT